jgi:hypothetical protein
MFPLACPTARVPNLSGFPGVVFFLPFSDGNGSGVNAKAVIADGVKSTNLQRCTASVIGSPILFSTAQQLKSKRPRVNERNTKPAGGHTKFY